MNDLSSHLQTQSVSAQDIKTNLQLENELKSFCQLNARGPDAINFSVDNYERIPRSFFYLIHKTLRFDSQVGRIFLLRNYGELIGISAVTQFPLNKDIAHGGVRSLLDRRFVQRFVITSQILPLQLSWAKEVGYREFVISFDEGNKGLAKMVKRITEGKLALLGMRADNFIKDMILLPYPVMVHGFSQSIVIKKIDPQFSFAYPPASEI